MSNGRAKGSVTKSKKGKRVGRPPRIGYRLHVLMIQWKVNEGLTNEEIADRLRSRNKLKVRSMTVCDYMNRDPETYHTDKST